MVQGTDGFVTCITMCNSDETCLSEMMKTCLPRLSLISEPQTKYNTNIVIIKYPYSIRFKTLHRKNVISYKKIMFFLCKVLKTSSNVYLFHIPCWYYACLDTTSQPKVYSWKHLTTLVNQHQRSSHVGIKYKSTVKKNKWIASMDMHFVVQPLMHFSWWKYVYQILIIKRTSNFYMQ